MYKIKQSCEDFIVKEISQSKLEISGIYALCLLKKTNYSTMRAVEHIAGFLNLPIKHIGFAGTKDKKAVTEQLISIKNGKKEKIENLSLRDIQLEFLGYTGQPISLGDLEGNDFIITIRNLKKSEIEKIEKRSRLKQFMPNYFGEQRFSKKNIDIGRNIVKGSYKEAVELIISTDSDYKQKLLSAEKNHIAALRFLPKKLLLLYTHAYQSYLWNKTLRAFLEISSQDTKIPIIGFGTELEDNKMSEIIENLMHEEKITFRDFINRKIPELSSEGSERDAFTEIVDLRILKKDKGSVKVQFFLQKGSYATVAVAFLLDSLDAVLKDFF